MAFVLRDNALSTLERVKDFVGLTDTSFDNKIIFWINDLSGEIEKLLKRKLGLTTYVDEELDQTPNRNLVACHRPIISVTSIFVDDEAVVEGDEIGDFRLTDKSKESGIIIRDCDWLFPTTITSLSQLGHHHHHCPSPIVITYIAGFILPKDAVMTSDITLPSEIESVIFNVIQDAIALEKRGGIGLSELRQDDVTFKFKDANKADSRFLKGRLAFYENQLDVNSDVII